MDSILVTRGTRQLGQIQGPTHAQVVMAEITCTRASLSPPVRHRLGRLAFHHLGRLAFHQGSRLYDPPLCPLTSQRQIQRLDPQRNRHANRVSRRGSPAVNQACSLVPSPRASQVASPARRPPESLAVNPPHTLVASPLDSQPRSPRPCPRVNPRASLLTQRLYPARSPLVTRQRCPI